MTGTYIIAECGQNHNGSVELGIEMIKMAASHIYHGGKRLPGCNAGKF